MAILGAGDEEPRSGSVFSEPVVPVPEFASFEGETSTADAIGETVSELFGLADPVVQLLAPGVRELFPIGLGWSPFARQLCQGIADPAKRDAHCLANLDDGYASQGVACEPSLVSVCPDAPYEALPLIEPERRDPCTGPCGYFADG